VLVGGAAHDGGIENARPDLAFDDAGSLADALLRLAAGAA
jgi:hypothetical protein